MSTTLSLTPDVAAAGAALASNGRAPADLMDLRRQAGGFVYALPRTPKSYAFLFVAPNTPAMGELVERFIALPALRDGAILTRAQPG